MVPDSKADEKKLPQSRLSHVSGVSRFILNGKQVSPSPKVRDMSDLPCMEKHSESFLFEHFRHLVPKVSGVRSLSLNIRSREDFALLTCESIS